MSWKCRHCGHEAPTEESCCWQHWQDLAAEREDFAEELGYCGLCLAIVIVAIILLAKFCAGGLH
jgi:hypothetical protein